MQDVEHDRQVVLDFLLANSRLLEFLFQFLIKVGERIDDVNLLFVAFS